MLNINTQISLKNVHNVILNLKFEFEKYNNSQKYQLSRLNLFYYMTTSFELCRISGYLKYL